MPKSSRADVRAHMMGVLRCVRDEGGPGGLCLSRKALARAAGSTDARLRLAEARLKESGCLRVESRFGPNGGQVENRYEVTDRGLAVLELYDRLVEEGALRR